MPEIFVDRLFEVARALDENALGRQRPHETAELMQTGGHGVRTKFAPREMSVPGIPTPHSAVAGASEPLLLGTLGKICRRLDVNYFLHLLRCRPEVFILSLQSGLLPPDIAPADGLNFLHSSPSNRDHEFRERLPPSCGRSGD